MHGKSYFIMLAVLIMYLKSLKVSSFPTRTQISRIKQLDGPPKLSLRMLNVNDIPDISSNIESISQSSADMSTYLQEGIQSFFYSFTMRTAGTILGQIVAAAFLKYLVEQVFSKMQKKDKMPAAVPESKPNEQNELQNKTDIPLSAWFLLLACVVIDGIGDSSYLLPGVGEAEDVVWAPLSAYMLSLLFGSNIITAIDFMKEIIPGSDFIPVATIAWVIKYYFPSSPLAKPLGLRPLDAAQPPDPSPFFAILKSKLKNLKSSKGPSK